jgi:hypothetical protein
MNNRKPTETLRLFPSVAALVALLCVSSFALTDEQYEAMISSPDWSCRFTDKANSAHLSDGSADTERTLSLVNIRCDGLGKNKSSHYIFMIACEARARDSVYDLSECAKLGFSKTKTWRIANANLANADKSSGPFKYGGSCRYQFPNPISLGRMTPDGKYDISCVNTVNCTNSKKSPVHFLAACDASALTTVNGKLTAVCPLVNDCLAKPLPLTPAFTQAELDNLYPNNQSTVSLPVTASTSHRK